nr:MAG TPA: Single strand binding protein [Caudoviricetes sp.]
MLNQIVLVGRLVQDAEIKELENGNRLCYINLAVPRSWKNADGIYETDFINCIVWNNIADNVKEYCKKGDLLGIKGRIQTKQEENKNIIEIVAEKVTFLYSRKETEEE